MPMWLLHVPLSPGVSKVIRGGWGRRDLPPDVEGQLEARDEDALVDLACSVA